MSIDKVLEKVFKDLADVKCKSSGIDGIPSGLKMFDMITGGLQRGNVIVIGGRPGVGKTSLALGFTLDASSTGSSVLYLTMDNSNEINSRRLLAMKSEISYRKTCSADLTSDEWVALTATAATLSEMPITIRDERMNFTELCIAITDHKQGNSLDLVVIDSLQGIIQDGGNANDYNTNYTTMAQAFKDLAKNLNICIVILSSVSKSIESRIDKRPGLLDLAYTGTLESEVDLILMLYRDAMYNIECENPESAELIIVKNSTGPTLTVYLNFIRELMKFEDAE